MNGPVALFDRLAVRARRERAARMDSPAIFLHDEIAERLGDRVDDVNRDFRRILVLGALSPVLVEQLRRRPDVDLVVTCDSAEGLARAAGAPAAVGEEDALPFAAGAFDLVIGVLTLHAVNDLPGALIQIRRLLVEDGLFLGAMFGGATLDQLRRVMLEAESEIEGGASPRVAPFADTPDAGGLLQRAGFALPVVDSDTITVTWPDALALMRDLRAMGETNALAERRRGPTRKATIAAAAARYATLFADEDDRVPADFQVLFLTGWAPAASQQQPLRPGSAAARLADALGAEERSAGERAAPKNDTD